MLGTNNQNTDPLFLGDGWTPGANGYALAGPIRESDLMIDDGGDQEEVGEVFDAVWRNTSDNTLLFATRLVLDRGGGRTTWRSITSAASDSPASRRQWVGTFGTDNDASAACRCANQRFREFFR